MMLTKEMIEEAKKNKNIYYDWGKNYKNKSVYDLYLTIGNCGYRVATYSTKTKRIILTCPQIHIPSNFALEDWNRYIEKKENGDE